MPNPPNISDMFQKILRDINTPNCVLIAKEVMQEFHSVAITDHQKLIDALKALENPCDDPNCTTCNVATKTIIEFMSFVNKVIEPHRKDYLELYKRTVSNCELGKRLNEQVCKQSRTQN